MNFQRCFHLFVLVQVVLLLVAPPAVSQEENTIFIIGKQREKNRPSGSGSRIIVKPNEESRFETEAQLKSESSLSPTNTGRVTPSGFVIPRIRGQETRVTEVFFEDLVLQDPYTGLPIVEDLDLRAFGALEIYQGVSPYNLPTTNPIGGMRYRMRPIQKNSTTIGLQTGSPFGYAGWGLGRGSFGDETITTDYQLYFRDHVTDGKYDYYDDNQTPYNDSDDKTRTRLNNHQRARQAIPYLKFNYGNQEFRYLGWWHEADRGIPAVSYSETNHANEQIFGNLNILTWKSTIDSSTLTLPDFIQVNVSRKDDLRKLKDTDQLISSTSSASKFSISTNQGSIGFHWIKDAFRLLLRSELATSAIKTIIEDEEALALQRISEFHYAGFSLSLPYDLLFEAKLNGRDFRDKYQDEDQAAVFGDVDSNEVTRWVKGASAALFWNLDAIDIYAQYAQEERAPSLIEEFGDGTTVRPNIGLDPETTKHKEIGVVWGSSQKDLRIAAATFQDDTEDKIVFVTIPTIINTTKADNLQKTRITGYDLQFDASYQQTHFQASGTRLFPYDLSEDDEQNTIPGVPTSTYALQLSQDFWGIRARWLARYRSKFYRDLRNSIEIGDVWIHDASLDSGFNLFSTQFKCGLSVSNVFDVKKVAIKSPDTGEEGYTAYSEVSGHPLPGRHWKLSTSAEF